MNLHAFFVLVHLGHLNIEQVIVLFRLCFLAQGFGCSTFVIKLFGGRDSIFGQVAILNFDHIEQAQ